MPTKIYFGIMKADFILGVGKVMEMDKEKNQEKVSNIALGNISTKAYSNKAKDKDMDKLYMTMGQLIWGIGNKVKNMGKAKLLKLMGLYMKDSLKWVKRVAMEK